ncbi:hypothetical protein LTR62_004564 [Meristemomyces frigidus]|uniref:Uncharacterized protein n=1 Tax=Meristemomyces frigidus TaxID=1508187 RepID=A0AAN7THI4_9PEZI|nr:hypothetical protein LTR62_004564 [Meristemomyces frigidus]
MATFLTALFRRTPAISERALAFPFTAETNPYRAQRSWPPDFSQLSSKHQFRLERRYRRRTKLKWARPNWKKGVTLVQWASILFVAGYGVLYLDFIDKGTGLPRTTVMDELRAWLKEQMSTEGTGRRKEAARAKSNAAQKG